MDSPTSSLFEGSPSFTCQLREYQGPLDLLVALVRRQEIDVFQVALRDIVAQLHRARGEGHALPLQAAADALAWSATLLLLKSRGLTAQGPTGEGELEEDPATFGLEHLLAYCRLKGLCAELAQREEAQRQHLRRPSGASSAPQSTPSLERVDPGELPRLLQALQARAAQVRPTITDEPIRVADALLWLKESLQTGPLPLESLSRFGSDKGAWIVLFLAILELLREGVWIARQTEEGVEQYSLRLPTKRRRAS